MTLRPPMKPSFDLFLLFAAMDWLQTTRIYLRLWLADREPADRRMFVLSAKLCRDYLRAWKKTIFYPMSLYRLP